jgi:hypothetical protein
MFHCQDPKSIGKDQAFPVCIEYQLLGGNGKDQRHTGNVCTPGTNIHYQGKLWTQHCTDSASKTYHGDRWVKAELEVRPSGKIVHRIEGEEVLEYEGAELDPNDGDAKKIIEARRASTPEGSSLPLRLSEGWIALQSESTPCEFRRIEIVELRVDGQRLDLPVARVKSNAGAAILLSKGRVDGYRKGLSVVFLRGRQQTNVGKVVEASAHEARVEFERTMRLPRVGDLAVPVSG